MEFLSFLPAWLTATPVNFVLVALVVMYLLSLLLESARDDVNKRSEVGIICGMESTCKRLAASLHRAERFELASSAAEILEQAMRRDMVILFIVKDELSGTAESVFAHLQNAYSDNENKDRYSSLRYAVFGIGDTLGEDFNALAVELDLRLRKVGAKSVVPMRLFDERTSEDGLDKEFFDFVMAFSPPSLSRGFTPTEIRETADSEPSDTELSQTDDEPEGDEEVPLQKIDTSDSDIESDNFLSEAETVRIIGDLNRQLQDAVLREAQEAEAKNVKAPIETSKLVEATKTTATATEAPRAELVEPSVDISTSVFESVEPEVEPKEPESGAVSGDLEELKDEPEASARSKSPMKDRSETDDDEGWEIIKVMSNKDDSS